MKKAKGIVIRNAQEKLAVETLTEAHKVLCEKLKVETALTYQRECNWGKNAKHAGWYRSSEKLVALNFRCMYGATIGDLLEVLAHEMRHAVQDAKGWHKLRAYKRGGMFGTLYGTWKGETMYVEYKKAPWEIDARKYEKPYAKIAIDALELTDEVLNTKLPMGISNTSDKQATYRLLKEKYDKTETINILATTWLKKKPKESGFVYVLTSELPSGFSFKKKEDCEWLSKKQKLMKFLPYIKITEEYGGFSVREMCS